VRSLALSFGVTVLGCGAPVADGDGRATPLVIDRLAPALETGAPFLRLQGGALRRPFDVPLWLTFEPAHRPNDDCAVGHEHVVLALDARHIYIAQYDTLCTASAACRILDVTDETLTEPAGGCIWGEGVHHRLEAVADGVVLLTSDGEGVGHIDLLDYRPERAPERLVRLDFGALGSIETSVRDGGVDFESTCPLPEGCGTHDSDGRVRSYRWTREAGLVPR